MTATLTTLHPDEGFRIALRLAGDVIDAYLSGDEEQIGFVQRNNIDREVRRAIYYLNDPDATLRAEGRRIIGRLMGDWNVFHPVA